MSAVALTLIFAVLMSGMAVAASVRIEDAPAARSYVDVVFAENDCRMTFAEIDNRMRADGIIPTEAEMQSGDIGVTKFIRQRRVMAAIRSLVDAGDLNADAEDQTTVTSNFGGCA